MPIQHLKTVEEIATALKDFDPILIEGPGPSDKGREASTVASNIMCSLRKRNLKNPIVVTQGDPVADKGISAISRIVSDELNVPRCLFCLDENIDLNHAKEADRYKVIYESKLSHLTKCISDSTYDRIQKDVKEKVIQYESEDWVEKYALLQEVSKVALKSICGSVTIIHTVSSPIDFSVTCFFQVGIDLGLIDKEYDMVKYKDRQSKI